MRIKVEKYALLRQIPNDDVMDWPEYLFIEGVQDSREEVNALVEIFRKEFDVLTKTQWEMFSVMIAADGSYITQDRMAAFCKPSHKDTKNIVATHVGSIRSKLNPLGYLIESKRGFGYRMTKK